MGTRNMLWLVVLLGGGAIFCAQAAESASDNKRLTKVKTGDDSHQRVLDYLRSPSFRDYTVRVYYRAECRLHKSEPFLPFPFVRIEAPAKGETGLAAARHIFRNARNVTVREDRGRIIRIWIGNVPSAILHTKIRLIKLDEETRHYKKGTVDAILKTKEVQAAMKSLGVDTPSYFSSETAINPPPYPAEMRNVTFDQALDVIAEAWDGIVVYGACTEPDKSGTKLFDIEAGNRVELFEGNQ